MSFEINTRKRKRDNNNYIVCATQTKNYILNDLILDWLDMYGEANNFCKDTLDNKLFPNFLMSKGVEFENNIVKILSQKYDTYTLPNTLNFSSRYTKTVNAMRRGNLIIIQGGVYNPNSGIYGIPDLIVRSDILNDLVNETVLTEDEISKPCKFNPNWHYRIIDIKFSTLYLNSDGIHILNNGMMSVFKSQLYVYNECISYMQKYDPNVAYILGRKWKYKKDKIEYQGTGCFDKLGKVDFINNDKEIVTKTFEAIEWIRKLVNNGYNWNIDKPSIKELYPNMSNKNDFPWHNVKKILSKKNKDITLLWNCGPKERNSAFHNGVDSWDSIVSSQDTLNINGKKAKIIDNIIFSNKDEYIFSPRKLKNWENLQIIKEDPLYFICDFETLNDLDDSFNYLPNSGGLSMAFMVGCIAIYKENGIFKREYKSFICKKISKQEESKIIDKWLEYMQELSNKFNIPNPKIYHWSKAEPNIYKNIVKRHNKIFVWKELNFVDLLEVFKNEPITVKGAFTYGLKDISRNLYNYGLISTLWDTDDMDGREAMVYAWFWNKKKSNKKNTIDNTNIMNKIEKYNYIDCKVIDEILVLLRSKS